jgi:glycosyltransferase involved in cell wall biosynthesis
MRLSILLPTHNRADVISYAIQSVLAQEFRDFELLVCGDGCTDGTAAVVQQLVQQDARVRWFDLPKAPGFGYGNRNTVLAQARGDLITYMQHDDIIAPDHLRRLVALMDDPAAMIAHACGVGIERDGGLVPTVFHLADHRMVDEFIAGRWNRIVSCSMMHRRSALQDVGSWDATLLQKGDHDYWRRLLTHYGSAAVRNCPIITVFHFRAVWRGNDPAYTDPCWQRLHEQPGRLSRWLRLPLKSGETEQTAFWRWLQEEPQLIEHLRGACIEALITHSWELEAFALPDAHAQLGALGENSAARIKKLEEKLAKLGEKLAHSQAKNQALRQQQQRKSGIARWWARLLGKQ